MYLYKNGVGVKMGLLGQKDEHTFILRNVSVLDSGNYSCVYSLTKHLPGNVRTPGHKSIQVQVTDEYTFILKNVSVLDSGRYSCVYSLNKHLPHNVRSSGYNSIQVKVTVSKMEIISPAVFLSSSH
ncbi:hypothetical protein NFI96_005975 [Prochilodus magdalenae]|nr:hypothetical protein NFI96_005975 [Prochilodus magdalenae]